MQPPRWVVEGGTRLDLDEFGKEFSTAWSRLESRFLKIECWQSYQESAANESQEAYRRGDLESSLDLLKMEAENDRPLYEDVRARAIEFARVRVVQEPVTEYLRYELMSYRIRATMGENIEVVREPSGTALPNGETFDFLLFDRRTALVHDYGHGPTGVQTGGWLVRDPRTIEALEERALALRADAFPLDRFLAQSAP